jgi:NTP pyrophosphatase (non-canonical NTP hydrolase)
MLQEEIIHAIVHERARQDKIHPMGKMKKGTLSDSEIMHNYMITNDLFAVLIEEVGEIGRALQGEGDLREELIQVASVCVRFLENL